MNLRDHVGLVLIWIGILANTASIWYLHRRITLVRQEMLARLGTRN